MVMRWHMCYVCDMTYSYVWHDKFTCVTWLAPHTGDALAYVWNDSFICVKWLIHMRDMTHSYVWHDSLTHMCDMTHSLIRLTLLVHMCDMTHSYVWHQMVRYPPPPSWSILMVTVFEIFLAMVFENRIIFDPRQLLLAYCCRCCHMQTCASTCTCSHTCTWRTF